MENNRVATINDNYKVLSMENYPTAEAAYEAWVEAIRILKKHLPKGETVTVIRYRWNQVMTMETVVGTH